MKSFYGLSTLALAIFCSTATQAATSIPCAFNGTKTCVLERDILNDLGSDGLHYYASTNYDHRISSEINVYNVSKVAPYQDQFNFPGQLRLSGNPNNGNPAWYTGEIMTRANLNQAPFSSPVASHPWSTAEIKHGYLEVVVKQPKCEASSDGLCQTTNPTQYPANYNYGLWPAIWMEPNNEANWPMNGEIDLMEGYGQYSNFVRSDTTIHFFGNSSSCQASDCVNHGYHVAYENSKAPLYDGFHTWGFEWQPDPNSKDGGQILTGYFDNVLAWGPLKTDSLPDDGPNALSRGFNDPNGGYYLIVNLAIGGLYTGPISSQVQTAAMYLQSAKAYAVNDTAPPPPPPPTNTCQNPANIQALYSVDKKQVTLSWQKPANSSAVQYYQINDWQNKLLWKGSSETQHCFTDSSLPGTSGNFTYYLYSICNSGTSAGVKYDVNINLKAKKK